MAFPTLRLTSPYTKGKYVKAAQTAMKTNKYGKYFSGLIDGVYGPLTWKGAKRAKYWLGYPKKEINGAYGARLHSYLTGAQPLPTTYKARRAYRKKMAAAATTVAERDKKLLAMMVSQIGYTETPVNITKYGAWYGWNGVAWCAIVVSWAFARVGRASHFRYAYVPYVVDDARRDRNGLYVVASPRPGDLVCYDFDGGVADHIGVFHSWKVKGESFYAVEGNTSPDDSGSQANGGGVYKRLRYKSQVEAFVRRK